jgi:hypothetical protein
MEGLTCVVADVRLPGINGIELQGGFEANGRSCQSSSSLLMMTMTSANGDPLLLTTRAVDGRWTVDAWLPLEGRNVNAAFASDSESLWLQRPHLTGYTQVFY